MKNLKPVWISLRSFFSKSKGTLFTGRKAGGKIDLALNYDRIKEGMKDVRTF